MFISMTSITLKSSQHLSQLFWIEWAILQCFSSFDIGELNEKMKEKNIFVIESAVVCVIGVPLGIVTSMRVGRELRMRIAVCRCVLFGFYCRCWKKLTLALQVVYRTRVKWRLVLHFAITVDVVVIESANSYRFNYKINTHTHSSVT